MYNSSSQMPCLEQTSAIMILHLSLSSVIRSKAMLSLLFPITKELKLSRNVILCLPLLYNTFSLSQTTFLKLFKYYAVYETKTRNDTLHSKNRAELLWQRKPKSHIKITEEKRQTDMSYTQTRRDKDRDSNREKTVFLYTSQQFRTG